MNQKQSTLRRYLLLSFIIIAAIVVLMLTILLVLGITFINTLNTGVLIALIVTISLLFIGLFGVIFIFAKSMYVTLYKNLYGSVKVNFEHIKNHNMNLISFATSKTPIKEFEELNVLVEDINDSYKNLSLTTLKNDYSNITLKYIENSNVLVTHKSLIKNISNLIYVSNSYRNAFIQFTYDLGENKIPDNEKDTIIDNILSCLRYDGILVAELDTKNGYLVYIPKMDSISRLKEEVSNVQSMSSLLSVDTIMGKEVVIAKASVVIYPFSNIEDILADLRYAVRQGKPLNFYLPARMSTTANERMLQNALNMNIISKVVSSLHALKIDLKKNNFTSEMFARNLKSICQYLNIEYAGLFLLDVEKDEYYNNLNICLSDNSEPIFPINSLINKEFVLSIDANKDEDNTYFFSNREHVSNDIAHFLDIYGISSGHYYVITKDNTCFGILYFCNSLKPLYLDSYLRESLFIVSTMVAQYLKDTENKIDIANISRRNTVLLKLSNYLTYTINKDTHEIVSYSDTLKDNIHDIKVGGLCYKTIFNKEKPCPKCPLVTQQKMIESFKGASYETSLALMENNNTRNIDLLMVPNESNTVKNRFDQDFMINSYFSFVDNLDYLYLVASRGYIILLSIDNVGELIAKYGNEGFAFNIRKFTDKIKDRQGKVDNIYLYRNNVLAIIIPESGRRDVIETCEAIYEISKHNFGSNETSPTPMTLTYEAIKYPMSYNSSGDIIRFIDRLLSSNKLPKGKDLLHFEENDYIRSASRTEFILSVIDSAVEQRTFDIRLQPMMYASNKRMLGAELLIRVNDDYQNLMLNTFEIINVAAKNGKIGVISDILMEFIGKLYKKHGGDLFKNYDFNRLSMNTDFSYFSDPDFLAKTEKVMNEYNFPKHFLSFEITEKEISQHYDRFKELTAAIAKMNITLVCDQYSGDFVSLEKIKELGFTEIKIGRNMVKDIDVDDSRLNEVKALIDVAQKIGLETSLVGVENKQQYNLIKESFKNVVMQGFYFYQPIGENEFVEALRKTNA